MSTPTQPTEAHRKLWTALYNLAHAEIFDDESSDDKATQLIADSEARAVAARTAERDKAEAERTDAIYQRMCEVEHELRAEVKRMTHAYEYDHKCLCEVRDRCHLWKQRAEKAEAQLAAAKERLRSEAMDDYASIKNLQRELATEREKVRVLRSSLENLCDEQNGPPLEVNRDQWQLAMDESRLALVVTEGAK